MITNMIEHEHSAEYETWLLMKQRCLNRQSEYWYLYGARGISIHTPWIESFDAFYHDVGPRPTSRHAFERININGHYVPGNVEWITFKEMLERMRLSMDTEMPDDRILLDD